MEDFLRCLEIHPAAISLEGLKRQLVLPYENAVSVWSHLWIWVWRYAACKSIHINSFGESCWLHILNTCPNQIAHSSHTYLYFVVSCAAVNSKEFGERQAVCCTNPRWHQILNDLWSQWIQYTNEYQRIWCDEVPPIWYYAHNIWRSTASFATTTIPHDWFQCLCYPCSA